MDHHSPHPTIPTSSAKRFFFATLHGSEGSMARTAVSAQRRPFSTSQRLGQGEEWTWPTWNYSCDKLKDVIIVFVCVLMRVLIKNELGTIFGWIERDKAKNDVWIVFGSSLMLRWYSKMFGVCVLTSNRLTKAAPTGSWSRILDSCGSLLLGLVIGAGCPSLSQTRSWGTHSWWNQTTGHRCNLKTVIYIIYLVSFWTKTVPHDLSCSC